jgi:alpha-mannosidase
MSNVVVYMLGHAHIDLGYRWDFAETIHRIAPWTFAGVLRVFEKYPGFTFAQSQMYLYNAMQREYPELFARIRGLIGEGRWEVVGCGWSEYDAMLPSGESIIRQHLVGLRYARDVLGVHEHQVVFVPDSFIGHAGTLPQILAGCGFRYYLFGRGLPQDPARPEATRRAFRWTGPDGSSIVAYLPFGPYSNPPFTQEHLVALSPYRDAAVADAELSLYGTGDHGGGPREPELESLERLSEIPGSPSWRFGTAHEYFRETFPPEVTAKLGVHRGSLRAFASGALTSQAQAKRWNRRLSEALVRGEACAAVATILQRKPAYPRVDFEDLWREVLTLQFHDILPGTSAPSVYRAADRMHRDVARRAGELFNDSFARIRSRISTRGDGYHLVVLNPCLSPVAACVTAPYPPWLDRQDAGLCVVDGEGEEVDAVWEPDGLTLQAKLPPLSYRLLRVVRRPPSRRLQSPPSYAGGILESDAFRVELDERTGDIVSVHDKARNKTVLRGPSNALLLFEEHEQSTSWVEYLLDARRELHLTDPLTVTKQCCFRTTVATTSRSRFSRFTREVTVYHQIPRIDFRLKVDWHDSQAFLKLGFAVPVPDQKIRTSLPHGYETVDDPDREFWMQEWVDMSGSEGGVALFNDGVHGVDVAEGNLRMSVIRTVRDMDPDMSHGRHEVGYSLYPHDGGTPPSELLHSARGFSGGPAAEWEAEHDGGLKSWGRIDSSRRIPAEQSFIAVDAPNVELCAVKMPSEHYTPDGLVVRIREMDGKQTKAQVRLPLSIRRAEVLDHLERPAGRDLEGGGDTVTVELAPFELTTFAAWF